MAHFISEEKVQQVILNLKESGLPFTYDNKKHKISIRYGTDYEDITLRLPITLSPLESINEIDASINYVILLIQSGSSALAYCEGDNMIDHKVFKSYMVRKKHGKSQIKYLKTKGKSKAGSRVRLGNAVSFFEGINERLQEYFDENRIDRIALSCSKTLIPYLFNSKIDCPFDKKDERIFKIPKHTHTPSYEVLLETHKFLQMGELSYTEENEKLVKDLLMDI